MKRALIQIPILVAAVLVATALWRRARAALEARQAGLERVRVEADSISGLTALARRRLADLNEELRREKARAAGAEAGEARLARANPDLRWLAPPEDPPAWNKESPYVWLRKSAMNTLPVPGLNLRGQLPDVACQLLDLTAGEKAAVEAAAAKLLADFGNAERAAAQPAEKHLNGVAGLPGAKVTIEIPPLPDLANQLQAQFDQALQGEIGAQRASLLEAWSAPTLAARLNLGAVEPTIISIRRAPDGSLFMARTGSMAGGTAGNDISLDDLVPPELLPLFQAVATPRAGEGDSSPPPP
jgi:hypothetical protein